jgi:hypothetical protein
MYVHLMRHIMTPTPKKSWRKAKTEGNVGAAAAAGIAGFLSKPKKDATGVRISVMLNTQIARS